MKKKKIFERYKDFDRLEIFVKRGGVNEIRRDYETFGWKLETEAADEKYEDLVDLTFVRPHKIKNKDELQLNQVFMEEKLNEIGKLERHRHAKSSVFAMNTGAVWIAALVLGILGFCGVMALPLWANITLVSVAGVIFAVEMFLLFKLVKKEKNTYKQKREKAEGELKEIIERAKVLSGGDDE